MNEFAITVPGGESRRLKTGGKYCPGDIVVTAEGSNIPAAAEAEFGREKIVETAPEGKAFYNGVLLPVFPAAGFEQCPYLMILLNSNGNYFAYGSTSVPYFAYRDAAKSLELPAGRNRCAYDPATDSWGDVESSTSGTWCNLTESWSIIWTNFDVPKDFATGKHVYFKATEPTEEYTTGYGEYVSGTQRYAVVGENLDELAHRMQLEYSTYDLFTGEEIREYVMKPPVVADHSMEDAFITGKLPDVYENDRVTYVAQYRLGYISGLKILKLPQVSGISSYAFSGSSEIESFEARNLNNLNGGGIFGKCTKLHHVDLGRTQTMGWSATFSNCSALQTIVLRRSSVAELGNVNYFNGTPFAQGGTGGRIYVPSNLIETYQTATNWSVLYGYGTCEFVALEGSEYE